MDEIVLRAKWFKRKRKSMIGDFCNVFKILDKIRLMAVSR